MAVGVTASSRRKLQDLRGKGAKLAQDKRVLAQTAILTAKKDKEAKKTIHVPPVVPEEVARLMKDNELENATIIFSHQALQLFTHMFGNSVQVAIESAMQDIDQKIEKAVEKQAIEILKHASAAMKAMMDPQEIVKKAVEDKLNNIIPMEDKSQTTAQRVRKMPHGMLGKAILEELRVAHPEPVKILTICKAMSEKHGARISSERAYAALSRLIKSGKATKTEERGFYIYKP
jgi:hypothetical protein